MDKRRNWLSIVLEEGLNLGVLGAEDVLRHSTPSVLATDLPPALVASLLQVGLDGGEFSSDLLVQHLGAQNLAEHVPLPVLWRCIDEAAERLIAEHPLSRGALSVDDVGAVVDSAVDNLVLDDDHAPDIEVIED
ncbi:MAG: hypothetical protein KC503_13440 [Myxococcales bacterium]|nr:hypothetical protein [Myxococcales bacterium]